MARLGRLERGDKVSRSASSVPVTDWAGDRLGGVDLIEQTSKREDPKRGEIGGRSFGASGWTVNAVPKLGLERSTGPGGCPRERRGESWPENGCSE